MERAVVRLLVTGGSGFQGSWLAEHWARQGYAVTVLNTWSLAARANLPVLERAGVTVLWGSVLDAAIVGAAMDGQDVVVHLAAQTNPDRSLDEPLATFAVNGAGTGVVLEAARARKLRVIASSSCEVYGSAIDDAPQDESAPFRPSTPYAAGKAAGDALCRAYRLAYGLDVTVLRPCNIYGPRQRAGRWGGVIPTFIDAALRNRPMVVRGGAQTREYLYVSDLVAAYDLILGRSDLGGEVFNLTSGVAVEIGAIAEYLRDTVGGRIDYESPRAGDVTAFRLDDAHARSTLKWAPEVDFWDGLRRCIEAGEQSATSGRLRLVE